MPQLNDTPAKKGSLSAAEPLSGVFIPFPISEDQALLIRGALRNVEADATPQGLEDTLRSCGHEIVEPPEVLKPAAFVNADRLKWKIDTGKDTCLTFSGKPWNGGGTLNLLDGIVFLEDHEAIVRYLNICLSEQARALIGLSGTIGDQAKLIASLEADKVRLEGSLTALSLRSATPSEVSVSPEDRGTTDNPLRRLIQMAYSLSRTAGMTCEDVVRLTLAEHPPTAAPEKTKPFHAQSQEKNGSISAEDFLSDAEIREMEFLNSLKDIIKTRTLQVMSERDFTLNQMCEHLGYNRSTFDAILNPDRHISTLHMFSVMDRLSRVWALSSQPIAQSLSCAPEVAPSLGSVTDAECVHSSLVSRLSATPSAVAQAVAELPDRTSPEGSPDMMLVTAEEISQIVRSAIEAAIEMDDTLLKTRNSAG